MSNPEIKRVRAQDETGANKSIGDITADLIAQNPSLGTGAQEVMIEGVFADGTSQVRKLTIENGEWTGLSPDLNIHPQ